MESEENGNILILDSDAVALMTPITNPIFDFHYYSDAGENQP